MKFIRNFAILFVFFYLGLSVGNGSIDLSPANQANKNLPSQLDYAEANQVYQSLKDNYDGELTADQLEEGLKRGLAASTKDPYTVYFTPQEAQDFRDDLNSAFSGIGAQLGQDKEGNLEVIAPIDGLPADKAGIKAKDIIATVNKESTSGMSVDEAVSKIRGKAGTKVTLQVVRNKSQALEFTVTRENIDLPSIKTKSLDNNIGYIQITTFDEETTTLARKAAEDFKAKGVKAIILDVRDNPGGLLPTSIEVSSLWLDRGKKILDEKQGNKLIDSETALGGNVLKDVPTVVLINEGSASASEIVAGALRDNKAAYLIGEKTYGKGVVQQLISFRDGGQLKVTVASWYRPNGQNINKKGITPDKTVKISDADAAAEKDTQLEAAQTYLNAKP